MRLKIIALLLALNLVGCASTSKHYTIDKIINGQKVKVDVIEQRGLMKAKHPTGAEGESKPWLQFPQMPPLDIRR